MIGATTQHNQPLRSGRSATGTRLGVCLVVPLELAAMDAAAGLLQHPATSVILLTLLPVARHGRLAMLDGTQLSAMARFAALLVLGPQPNQRTLGPSLA